MKTAKISIVYPLKEDKIKIATLNLKFNSNKHSYEIINHIRDEKIYKKEKYQVKTRGNILIKDLTTLHNIQGIQKRNKLLSMKGNIKSGRDIFEFGDFPNVNVILSKNKEYVVFDGSHTVLAYLLAGKNFLCEVPHILIETKEIDDSEILEFFLEHKNKVKNWKDYCINWNVPFDKQLEPRKQNTIGEVFDLLNKS